MAPGAPRTAGPPPSVQVAHRAGLDVAQHLVGGGSELTSPVRRASSTTVRSTSLARSRSSSSCSGAASPSVAGPGVRERLLGAGVRLVLQEHGPADPLGDRGVARPPAGPPARLRGAGPQLGDGGAVVGRGADPEPSDQGRQGQPLDHERDQHAEQGDEHDLGTVREGGAGRTSCGSARAVATVTTPRMPAQVTTVVSRQPWTTAASARRCRARAIATAGYIHAARDRTRTSSTRTASRDRPGARGGVRRAPSSARSRSG